MAEDRRRKTTKGPVRTLLRWVFLAIFVIAVLFFLVFFTGGTVTIKDGAMNQTLYPGDKVILDRLSYYVHNPGRGDIVEFTTGEEGGTVLIRRIVGLPGETVQIQDGKVSINGSVLDESAYTVGSVQYAGRASKPLTLPADEYFVMADNRNSNFDSRDPTVGDVSKASIRGRLWLRISPADKLGLVK